MCCYKETNSPKNNLHEGINKYSQVTKVSGITRNARSAYPCLRLLLVLQDAYKYSVQ